MIWRRPALHYLESSTGHRVDRCRVGEQVRYTAWGPAETGPRGRKIRRMLGTFDTAEEAKHTCESGGEDAS